MSGPGVGFPESDPQVLGQGLRGPARFGFVQSPVFQPHQPGKGRIPQALPVTHLFLEEQGVILGRGSPDRVVLGHVGLNDSTTGALPAPSPTHHLGQHLKGALRGPVVGQGEADVGQDHAHQGDFGQIQALGQHLGTDEHVGLAAAEVLQEQVHLGLGGGRVPVPAVDTGLGQASAQLFFQTLCAPAYALNFPASACRAGARPAPLVMAVVAHQGLLFPVVHQGHLAPGALEGVAAVPAEDVGVGAPAVEEEQRLFAATQGLLQGFQQRAAQDTAVTRFPRGAHVHHLHLGQAGACGALRGCGPHPFRQGEQAVAALSRAVVRDHVGGGRAQQRHALHHPGVQHGHLPGVVVGAPFRVGVGVRVGFVHHDEAQPGQGREHRAARTDEHLDVTPPGAAPGVVALAQGKPGVQHPHLAGEPGQEAPHQRGGQADFRHQHQGLPALGQGVGHGPQVNFRLP